MTTFPRRYTVRAAFPVIAILVVVAACESSDKVPPKGATITVAANPATIPLASGPECVGLLNVPDCGTANVVATVASALGIPLPGQDVRFSSTAGFLFLGSKTNPIDAANIPIRTDKFGNATVNLITSTTATVTAKSGLATPGTLTINTVSGNLSTIILNQDTTSSGCSPDLSLTSCSETVCLVAQALDSNSVGVQGVVLLFVLQNNVFNGSTLSGTFVDQAVTTDVNGKATSKFTPDSGTCPTQCSAAQGKSCRGEVVVTTQGASFQSNTQTLTVQAP